MSPSSRPIPVVPTSAPDVAPTTTSIAMLGATGITVGNDFTAPANSLPVFPMHPFVSSFDTTLPPLHFDGSNPFPTSSGGLFDDAAASNLPIGTFDPYQSIYPSSPANNHDHTLIVGPSTVGTDRSKRSRPQETSEGKIQHKRRKVEKTAEHAVRQWEPGYQAFEVGRNKASLPVVSEESTTNAEPPTVFNTVARPPGMTNREYVEVLKAQIARQFPDTRK